MRPQLFAYKPRMLKPRVKYVHANGFNMMSEPGSGLDTPIVAKGIWG